MRRPSSTIRTILLLGGTATLAGATHPEATLKSETTRVAAGASWSVTGEEFLAGQKVQLMLQGALAEYPLREVQATDAGTLSLSLEIPATVRPGAYSLVAIADDGETVARLDVTIDAASPVAMAEHEIADERDAGHGGMTEARADEMPIERSRASLEWGVIGLLIGLAGGFGLSLVRRPA